MIQGYSEKDIILTLKRIYKETEENRERAIRMYEMMETYMNNDKGDLIILSQMADKYLSEATKQTEMLVKLSATLQKLNQYNEDSNKNKNKKPVDILDDLLSIQNKMDDAGVSPFKHQKPIPPKNINLKESQEY